MWKYLLYSLLYVFTLFTSILSQKGDVNFAAYHQNSGFFESFEPIHQYEIIQSPYDHFNFFSDRLYYDFEERVIVYDALTGLPTTAAPITLAPTISIIYSPIITSPIITSPIITSPIITSPTTLGRITVTTTNSKYYYAYYGVGNQKSLKATIDTGANTVWVRSTNYNCTSSSTCATTNQILQISYSSFSVSGPLTRDNFNFGGLISEGQGFAYIQESKPGYVDGWLPLGVRAASGVPTILDNLKAQGKIMTRSFSIYLKNYTGVTDNQSFILLGSYDLNYAAFGLSFIYIGLKYDPPSYWIVTYLGTSIYGRFQASTGSGAIIDCGVNHIQFVPNDWKIIYAALNKITPCRFGTGSAEYQCTCANWDTVLKFPIITVRLGVGTDFPLTPRHYLTYDSKRGVCNIWMRARTSSSSIMTLGTPFFNAYYIYFNKDAKNIGFVPANPFI